MEVKMIIRQDKSKYHVTTDSNDCFLIYMIKMFE